MSGEIGEKIKSIKRELILFPFYPILLLLTSPFVLILSLFNLRVLGNGRWGDFCMFTSVHGINRLYVLSSAIALYRYGRRGRCPYLGDGDFELSRWFFYSLPSLYIFSIAPNISVVFGLFFLVLSHFIWIKDTNLHVLLSVFFLSPISSLFYANMVLQNYNILGWMFYPPFIYGLLTKNLLISSVFFFLSSFGGATQVFVGNIICILYSIYSGWYEGIVCVLPANLKFLMHFFPMLSTENKSSTYNKRKIPDFILYPLRGIGFVRGKTKYKRPVVFSPFMFIILVYFITIFGQFSFFSFFFNRYFTLFTIIGIIIFFFNFTSIWRFADIQTLYILMLIFISAEFIFQGDIRLLPSYWIAISPLPLLLGVPGKKLTFFLRPLKPFYIKEIIEKVDEFMKVPKNSRVFFAFDDPQRNYNKIFDGYRVLLEVPIFVGVRRGFLVMPNWHMVFKYNKEGDPDFWGRSPDEVIQNMNRWNCDFCVIYEGEGEKIDLEEWRKKGFEVISEFDWHEFREKDEEFMYGYKLPKWFLLKYKDV